jgi:nucleotide-binding universal stress UspA family protein
MIDFKRILVATDFSPSAERALELAMEIGRASGATITLFHASWLPPAAFGDYGAHAEGINWHADDVARAARKTLEDALARARARYPATESAVAFGEPWRAILEAITERNIDLVVMGTHGRRGLSHLVLGSVAEKIVRLSPVPVLTVTAEAARSTRDVPLAPSRAT